MSCGRFQQTTPSIVHLNSENWTAGGEDISGLLNHQRGGVGFHSWQRERIPSVRSTSEYNRAELQADATPSRRTGRQRALHCRPHPVSSAASSRGVRRLDSVPKPGPEESNRRPTDAASYLPPLPPNSVYTVFVRTICSGVVTVPVVAK